jgi:protein-disulfide isomerase
VKQPVRALADGALLLAALGTAGLALSSYIAPRTTGLELRTVKNAASYYQSGHRIGPQGAPYTFVVWTDYQCPACARLEREIAKARLALNDSVAVIYHNFPLSTIHPAAMTAAIAAECAYQQHRFAEMHAALFASQLDPTTTDWTAIAVQASIPDRNAFKRCLAGDVVHHTVERDAESARRLHLGGTPSVLLGNQLQLGGMPAEELVRRVRHAADWGYRTGVASPPGLHGN